MDHSTPTLPEPDLYERLVTLVDSAVAERGWYSPHVLIKVEETGDPDSFDLGLKDLPDDAHPVDELWGFQAPASWLAMGVVTFGWASPMDGVRPSQHPERTRVRATILMTRDGRQVTTASFEDGTAIDEPGEGLIGEVLRLCLGLPTAPPPPIDHLADVLWLQALVAESAARTLSIAEAQRLYNEPTGRAATWEGVREMAHSTGRWPFADTWMDDGFFARQFLASLPTIDELLSTLDVQLPRSTARAVRALVEAPVSD